MITRRRVLAWTAAVAAGANAARSLGAGNPDQALKDRIFYRSDARYEPLRLASTWNARKPDRFPEAIVLPENDAEVIAAVRLAAARGWQVGSCSGRHSWNATHIRDHALLINLARLKELSVDPRRRLATVSPAWQQQAFNKILRERYGLNFPAAHCVGVGLGGFVLCGGHGWNVQMFGLGCENLQALDVVTADGELIHVDEEHHSDYLWAARGAGPGFFGVVLRMYLRVHPLPSQVVSLSYVYPAEVIDELIAWVDRTSFPDYTEWTLMRCNYQGKPAYRIRAGAFCDSARQAKMAVALFDSCPVLARAVLRQITVPAILPGDAETPHELSPTGARYFVDGAWVNGSAAEVYALVREELANPVPTQLSRVQLSGWRVAERKPRNMAYSLTARAYVAPTAISYDPSDDARCAAWAKRIVDVLKPIKVGAQLNDDNMPVNNGPYLSAQAAARLETLRAKHDPERRFVSYLS